MSETERKSLEDVFGKEKEEELYNSVLKALEQKFMTLGDVHLENTSNGRFSEGLKEQLDDYSLFMLKIEKMSPDLTGYLRKKETYGESKCIIVVEIKKDRPTLKDIYQTKRYAEILKADYALLIAPKKLSTERRKFLIKNKGQITQFYPNKQILIGQFIQYGVYIEIDRELYYDLPEPFKEPTKTLPPL
jgi:hypothetical protein